MDVYTYHIKRDQTRCFLRSVCGLSVNEINVLEDACFRRATTTLGSNHDVTLSLLTSAYSKMLSGKKYEDILCEIIDLDWLK